MIDLLPWLGLNKIRPNDAVADAVTTHRDDIADLIKDQLDLGQDGDKQNLGAYANIRYKGYLSPVNLKRTGEWRRGIDVIADNNSLNVVDIERKTPWLTNKYGGQILKLSTDSEFKAAVLLQNDVVRNIEKQVKG